MSSEPRPDATRRALQRAEEIYAALPPLRALAVAIPFVGGSIDALIGGYASKLAEHRIHRLLEELRAMLHDIDEAKLDKSFLETEEWADLFMKAFAASTRTGNDKKIRLYAAILAASTVSGGARDPAAESLLNALAELSPAQVEVLSMLHRAAARTGYVGFGSQPGSAGEAIWNFTSPGSPPPASSRPKGRSAIWSAARTTKARTPSRRQRSTDCWICCAASTAMHSIR